MAVASGSYRKRLAGFGRTHGVSLQRILTHPGIRSIARSHIPKNQARWVVRQQQKLGPGELPVATEVVPPYTRQSVSDEIYEDVERNGQPGYSIIVLSKTPLGWTWTLYWEGKK